MPIIFDGAFVEAIAKMTEIKLIIVILGVIAMILALRSGAIARYYFDYKKHVCQKHGNDKTPTPNPCNEAQP
jgi:hypothetical protein